MRGVYARILFAVVLVAPCAAEARDLHQDMELTPGRLRLPIGEPEDGSGDLSRQPSVS